MKNVRYLKHAAENPEEEDDGPESRITTSTLNKLVLKFLSASYQRTSAVKNLAQQLCRIFGKVRKYQLRAGAAD